MELIKINSSPEKTLIEPVTEILESLSTIKISDDRKLFSYKSSKAATASLKKFEKYCVAIYSGFFIDKYLLNKDELKRNNSIKRAFPIIKSCAHNWKEVQNLFIYTALKYKKWFDPDNEPLKKDWLPRDIARWVYDEYCKKSVFMLCMVQDVESRYNRIADVNIQKLPDAVYIKALKIEEKLFESFDDKAVNLFWFGVIRTYKMEKVYASRFHDDYMVMLWLEFGKDGKWTEKYLQWLYTCWGEKTEQMLKPWHIGPKGKTWQYWIKSNADLKNYWNTMLEISESYYD